MKISQVKQAFFEGRNLKVGNHSTQGGSYYLFNNKIMWKDLKTQDIFIDGYSYHNSKTTKATLGSLGIRITSKKGIVYLKEQMIPWDGNQINYTQLTPQIVTNSLF